MTTVVFDYQGTLAGNDPVALLGREYDVENQVQGLADREIDGQEAFADVLRRQVSLLEGMPERDVARALERGKLRDGAADLIGDLRRSGVRVVVITGSFERAVEAALERTDAGVDHLVANRLVTQNGALTGAVEGPLLDDEKDQALQELVATEGIDLQRTIAVGDGYTDLPVLQVVGTAIGFEPDPVVENYCDVVVTSIEKLQLYFEQHDIIEEGDRPPSR